MGLSLIAWMAYNVADLRRIRMLRGPATCIARRERLGTGTSQNQGATMRTLTSKDPLARLAERQDWLTPENEEKLQDRITSAVMMAGGDNLRRILHGDWLHEPLHAVLTDVPVGSWTATVLFDAAGALTGSTSMDHAADATLILGLVGATGAAMTGINDWAEIRSPAARRIGLVHASLNIAATVIFLASAVARYNKGRNVGRVLAGFGFVFVAASAHLGGSLVYEHRIGVAENPGTAAVTADIQS